MRRRSLLFKLRAGVIGVVLIGLVSLYSEWTTLGWLGRKAEGLTEQTSSLLQVTREIPELSLKLGSFPSRLLDSRQVSELEDMERQIQRTFSEIVPLAEYIGESGQLDFATGQAVFQDLLALQHETLVVQERIAGIVTNELQRLERMSRTIRRARSLAMLELASGAASVTPPGGEQDNSDTIIEYTRMESSLARLIILTQTLKTLPAHVAYGLRPQVIREIEAMATALGRLPKSEAATALALDMSGYQSSLLGLGRGFEFLATRQELDKNRRALLNEAIEFVATLVTWSDGATNRANADFAGAITQIRKRIANARIVGVTITFFLWTAGVLLLWHVLERTLFARLARITRRIRTLNAGDVATPLAVSGNDEVGEVEEAVERSRQLAEELTNRNEELDRFAYVAAHDLRAPLRAVKNLIEWTVEDHGADLPAGAKQNLEIMEDRVTRLSSLLGALLDYARAGQTQDETGPFDLGEFAEDLRQVHFPDSGIDIVVEGLPPVIETYPTPVRTILLNLVSNAIKHHDRAAGRVVLDAVLSPGGVCYRVCDDGPGIPAQYHERVFVLFQTLKSRDEVEGSGLGLALTQKLAASCGGSVVLRSDPEIARGATFEFHLPFGMAAQPMPAGEIAA